MCEREIVTSKLQLQLMVFELVHWSLVLSKLPLKRCHRLRNPPLCDLSNPADPDVAGATRRAKPRAPDHLE